VPPYQQMPYTFQPQFAPPTPAAPRQSRAPIIITGLVVLMTIVAITGFLLIGMGVVSLGPTLAQSPPAATGKDQPAANSSGNQQIAPDAQITNSGVPLSVGSAAPNFSLLGIDGQTYTLSGFKGRPVVLEFIATWCPHCQNDAPMMNQLAAAYKSKGVQVLAINATVYGHTYEQTGSQAPATMSDLQWFHDTFSVSFPLLFDKELKSANDYQVASYPTIYIVDQNGNIGFQPLQARVPNYSTLAAALDKLLAAPAPPVEPGAVTPAATSAAQGQAGSTATYMVINTAKGKIVCKLYTDPSDGVPKTIANFVSKARDGYFNGLTFHRVEDWVIQGGDPLGNGTGGGSMPAEYNNINFGVGALGVARGSDPAINNDSQFFIVKDASAAAGLVDQYTNFGQVVQGMDVVNNISIGDKIISITIQSQNP
jgi:peptidyl-prolyl cis-trans isomerase B (cyclophilin B)